MFTSVSAETPIPAFAEVALPLPLRRTFTYRLPANIGRKVQLGSRLMVPFGKRNLTGYVVHLHTDLPADLGIEESALKDAAELLDEEPLITPEILKLTQWTADYYFASWGEMLKAALPAGINSVSETVFSITKTGREKFDQIYEKKTAQILAYLRENGDSTRREIEQNVSIIGAKRSLSDLIKSGYVEQHQRILTTRVKPKRRKAVRLVAADDNGGNGKSLTAPQQRILETLTANGGELLFTELLEQANVAGSTINTLAKRGYIEVFVHEVLRDPLLSSPTVQVNDLTLTGDQNTAFREIEEAISANEFKPFLMHGITGSGKTEVYIRAMKYALEKGRSSLMLVPEIALTPFFSQRLRAVFGTKVAILHSSLSSGERFDEWRRLRRGAAQIAIGTRSAVFAPLQNLGLVVVDEEHDASYRQHESPFYNARDAAVMRANFAGAAIVLGSATPALESFYNAQNGKYTYLHLPERIGSSGLANAEIVDMREVFRQAGKDVTFSPQLLESIRETHAKGEQTIILLNRRGFSQFVLCRSCGETLRCKNCDITLTFHKQQEKLVCHYCNYRVNVPVNCPFCESEFLHFVGEGTEQLEDSLKKKFPDLRIERIDRDTVNRRRDMEKILRDFSRGEIDMLVGTQMIAKGHDFPNVTLVGVISVDLGLGLPDFRSGERTFQLLTQVAGRAGRGDRPGRVLIQTYHPEHYVLRHARHQDYQGFYGEETRYRQRMGYPPYYVLASILIKHADYAHAAETAQTLRNSLDAANPEKTCRILGPAPASLARLKGEHRLQILIKAENRSKLRQILDIALADAEAKSCDLKTVFVEIDPVNML
jgi:primosomal protein N' (replication factor Y)